MSRRLRYLTILLVALLGTSLALAAEPSTLRQRLDPQALAYLRIPSLWGLFSQPKGSALDAALGSDANQITLPLLREGVMERLTDIPDPTAVILLSWLADVQTPLELALQNSPTGPELLAQTQLGRRDVGVFLAELEVLLEQAPELTLAQSAIDDGTAQITTPAGPAYLHLDADSGLLQMRAGPGAGPVGEIPAAASAEHPMASLETRIDQSGQGLFLWLNGPTLMPLLSAQIPEDTLAGLAMLGLNPPGQAALGYGVSGGNGKLSVLIDLPQAGMVGFVPRVTNSLSLETSGEPGIVLMLSLPVSEMLRQGEALLAAQSGSDFAEYQSFRQEIEAVIGMSLEQALGSIGPELLLFSDSVGEFLAIRINNSERLAQLLNTLDQTTQASYQALALQDTMLHRLVIPGIDESLGEFTPNQYFYWIEDGDYLILSQLPQPLRDRLGFDQRVKLDDWLRNTQGQDPDHALLLLSTRLDDIPRRAYYGYLQLLQALADITGKELDLSAFPSAGELSLAETGSYGLQLDLGDRLGISFTFQNNPLEVLMQPAGMGAVAVLGIVAAVAIPAYQDYLARAEALHD